MLQGLELVGFKSFADKTRFEFAQGITVVVGPNGSGKSNVVDAVRWVLGEQSAKSLRGREMADVIFNGSATRRPLATAEVTLSFNNRQALLPIDAPLVHVTRRVYRSGEGEYLINRQPVRLRDVRELFAGTGAATQAYSIIEQGKVDVLLQASARDRRMIFEEAAGISRFKVKKLEAERRLERVELNLVRLKDIVDEVEGRLRSVRLQAGKARRYREHTERLRALRTSLAQLDSHELTQRLAECDEQLAESRRTIEAHQATAHEHKRALDVSEAEFSAQGEELRRLEVAAAQNRERLAHQRATLVRDLERHGELLRETDELHHGEKELAGRLAKAMEQLTACQAELAAAGEQHARKRDELTEAEAQQQELLARQSTARQEVDTRRASYVHALRAAAALTTEVGQCEAELASISAHREQLNERAGAAAKSVESLTSTAREVAAQQASALSTAREVGQQRIQSQTLLADLRKQAVQLAREQSRIRQRHAVAVERSELLEELERRLEGIEAGTKEILLRARQGEAGPLRAVHGLVADLLHVNLETAAWIELALGEASHALVTDTAAGLIALLDAEAARLPGRVSLIGLDLCADPQPDEGLRGLPGVVARADELVETTADYRDLARRLLGRTWIVDTLATALELASGPGRGLQLVTRNGHLISAEGRLALGPRPTAAGVLSRRSELRALAQQISELAERSAETDLLATRMDDALAAAEQQERELASAERQSTDALADRRSQASLAQSQLAQATDQLAAIAADLRQFDRRQSEAANRRLAHMARQVEVDATLADLDLSINEALSAQEELERIGGAALAAITAAQVALARSEQRLDGLRQRTEQFERDSTERQEAQRELARRTGEAQRRAEELAASILSGRNLQKELEQAEGTISADTESLLTRRDAVHRRRDDLSATHEAAQQDIRKLEQEVHGRELAAQTLRHQRESLAARLREDYGIELDDLARAADESPVEDRATAENEVAELRRKLQQLGNVNLDALDELEALEERFGRLSAQYDDLTQARSTLLTLIGKINEDSRKLFAATMETVREHFQELFRKLFGGGQADIVLEPGVDLLDSGVEIVARPPGKELRSISLMSGGEKTLTAVALLLAIFRSRPSPFCILDEVDAALDEANIERFIAVLHEFLAWTQFIVVTHSKKTMTAASTLYGVTMQESGVSKRVAVRFEDVSEDGRILRTADAAEEPEAA